MLLHFLYVGVNLLWDATLLRCSTTTELTELVDALQAAATRLHAMTPDKRALFKAFLRAEDMQGVPQHSGQLSKWANLKVVETLPRDYISRSQQHGGTPGVIRDAVKVRVVYGDCNEIA